MTDLLNDRRRFDTDAYRLVTVTCSNVEVNGVKKNVEKSKVGSG